ncbi:MAG: hypothetical protein V4685_11705 [Bacteroidota bacterium]
MNNKRNNIYIALIAMVIIGAVGCKKELKNESTAKPTSIPYIVESYLESFYASGVGAGVVYSSIPDTLALIGDSLVGFEGGFGGVTGQDFKYVLKSDITDWPDTTSAGGYAVTVSEFNAGNFKVDVGTSVVLASPIEAPAVAGPTDIAGSYLRTATGITIDIVKIFDGVYVIGNPGAGAVDAYPYLLYNYRSVGGTDSLAFPAQPNPCGGATKLVNVGAPNGLSIAEYDESWPPGFASMSPITLSWRIYEFTDTDPGNVHGGAALCQWGLGIRTLIKQ